MSEGTSEKSAMSTVDLNRKALPNAPAPRNGEGKGKGKAAREGMAA